MANRKTRKLLFLRENGFRKHDMFIALKRRTAKTEMTARTTIIYHDFINISFCDDICQSNLCFSRKHGFSFFCTANAFHHEIMFWLEGCDDDATDLADVTLQRRASSQKTDGYKFHIRVTQNLTIIYTTPLELKSCLNTVNKQ